MHHYERAVHDGGEYELGLDPNARAFPAHSLSELRPVFEKLENWMRVLGYARKDIFAVTLALHEAAANGIRHGHRGDPRKRLYVRYLVTPDVVVLEVEDEGPGFDVSQAPDPLLDEYIDRPCGRGLFLMRAYMSWVSYNPAGNRVTLGRRRSAS